MGGRPRQSLAEVVWNICFSGCLTWPGPLLSPPIAHPPSTFHLSTLHPLHSPPSTLHPSVSSTHYTTSTLHLPVEMKARSAGVTCNFSGVGGGLRRGCILIRNRDVERWRGGELEVKGVRGWRVERVERVELRVERVEWWSVWGWRVEGGGWRVEGGGWRVEGGGWRVEGGGWRGGGVEGWRGGGWRGGGWRVEGGGRWRVEGGGQGGWRAGGQGGGQGGQGGGWRVEGGGWRVECVQAGRVEGGRRVEGV